MSSDHVHSAKSVVATIRRQNDAFRSATPLEDDASGLRTHTSSIAAFDEKTIVDIWQKVRMFAAFTPDNDPHGEHDFGSFDHPVAGRVFWKIDYYDLEYRAGSDDPSDPTRTRRVLTVMLAEEY